MTAICDLAARHGLYVISDEIYRGLEWSGEISPAVVNALTRLTGKRYRTLPLQSV